METTDAKAIYWRIAGLQIGLDKLRKGREKRTI